MVHDDSIFGKERKLVIVTQHSDLSRCNEMKTDVEYARLKSCVTWYLSNDISQALRLVA